MLAKADIIILGLHTNRSPVISCGHWEALFRLGIHPKRREPPASVGIKKRSETYNQRDEEVEALDGFFSDVTQVLPQFLGILFGKYQRGIVSGSDKMNL